jgi:hypothetical protein
VCHRFFAHLAIKIVQFFALKIQTQTLQIERVQTSFPLVLAELRSRNILLIKTYHYHACGDEHPLANLGREVLIHTMSAAPLRN